ncbi:MAG: LysM peptidoglycan-binding domain-containing protein [Sedimenticola sp.]|nr:LysM peptidoglycan-binding domain-containing protein [Sedimenticola sp.]
MVRKLSLAVALVLGITPLGSYAVGLGNIHLNSALNQYFDADIELLSVEQEEVVDIKVELASPEAFRRSGLDRPFILSKLRFRAEQTDDGKAVIRVSSRDPIREPFLNFLIEVNWPKGRMLREYTVLLDPPVTLARKPAPVEQAPMQPRTSQRPESAPAPRQAQTDMSPGQTGGEYGPTRRNDTLWGIASRYRTEGATMVQMMIALQRANPQAFIDQNINKLKTGQVLRIPRADEVLELSRRDASDAYREQLDEWQADTAPAEQMADTGEASMESPMAPMETMPEAEAELKIASARPAGEGTAGPSEGADDGQVLEQLKQELIASEEAKQAALQEAEVTRSRVEDLEAQLEDLQRLLSLKSDQLAQLQAAGDEAGQPALEMPEMAEEPAVSEDAPTIEPAGEMAEAESPVMAMPDDAASGEVQAEAASPLVEESVSPIMEETVSPVMEESAPPVMESPAEAAPEPAVVAEEPPAKPASQTPPAKEQGVLDMIAGDTTLLGAAVGGIVVLLGLLWMAISRRRSSSADFQESILISTVDDTDSEQLTETTPDEPVTHPTEETSFLSDFSPSDIDALQDETGEVDPLAEADVYIAYGRYQQAEELIRQAIEKAPERHELKHKLFEILYATKDKDAFVSLAESASSEGLDQKEPEAWARVVSMGTKLAADHALFSGAATGESLLDDDDLASLEDELSLDDELGLDESSTTVDLIDEDESGDRKADQQEEPAAAGIDEDSGFSGLDDLDDLTLDSDLASAAGSDEIDLGDLEESADEKERKEQAEEDSFSLDDLDSLDADTDISLVKPEAGEEESDSFDLTLDSLDADDSLDEESLSIEDPLESAELDELKSDTESEAENLEEGVIDFSDSIQLEEGDSQIFDSLELEQVEDVADEEKSEPDSFSLDDLEQDEEEDSLFHSGDEATDEADEVNTKLDLARAYVDMEDAEGARSILEEVLKEGNEGQQKLAREMLDKLA